NADDGDRDTERREDEPEPEARELSLAPPLHASVAAGTMTAIGPLDFRGVDKPRLLDRWRHARRLGHNRSLRRSRRSAGAVRGANPSGLCPGSRGGPRERSPGRLLPGLAAAHGTERQLLRDDHPVSALGAVELALDARPRLPERHVLPVLRRARCLEVAVHVTPSAHGS